MIVMYELRKHQQQVKIARYMILGTVIATVVNLVLLFAQADLYIPYCAATAYYFGWNNGRCFSFCSHSIKKSVGSTTKIKVPSEFIQRNFYLY